MLKRIVLLCLLGGFMLPAMAEQSHLDKATTILEKKVVELERSVAILQLSSASTDDYQALEGQIDKLKMTMKVNNKATDRINFLSNVVFLLCVILLICLFFLRRQSHQLTALLKTQKSENSL